MTRYDETWHRLLVWTSGQAASERLAVQVLLADGFTRADPHHPLGGPDGGTDATLIRDGRTWRAAVYFPRGQRLFGETERKFRRDLGASGATASSHGFVFVTNQELSLAQRKALREAVEGPCEIYHLERVAAILDQPRMAPVREQFLGGRPSSSLAEVRPIRPSPAAFVARQSELHRLERFLHASSEPGVVVVSGLPGGGKTALARRAAETAARTGRFTGGTFEVDLRGYDPSGTGPVHAEQVYAAALRCLGADDAQADPGTLAARYHAVLHELASSGRPVLALLDNTSSASQVAPLLPSAAVHRVIVTSRNNIAPLLEGAFGEALAPLSEDAAAGLVASACATASRALDEPEAGRLVAELARLCAGLPLALRIAAAILIADDQVTVRELVDELTDETRRLDALQYEEVAVRTALQASYIRLSEADARCFRDLSLHPGGELSDETVAVLLDVATADARRSLRRLSSAGLVERVPGTSRWQLHDLVRLHSAELSRTTESDGSRRAAQRRLLDFYADRLADAGSWINSVPAETGFVDRAAAVTWLHEEAANLVAAAHVAHASGELVAVWRLGSDLTLLLGLLQDHESAVALLERARAAARELGLRVAEAAVLNNLGLELTALGRYDEAATRFRDGIEIASTEAAADEEANLLVGLARVVHVQHGPTAAVELLHRAAHLRRATGDKQGLAFCLTNIGITLREADDPSAAVGPLRQGLKLHRQCGARRAEAATLTQLATALAQLGLQKEAKPLFEEAVTAATDVEDWSTAAGALCNLGLLHRSLDELDAAADALERGLRLVESSNAFAVRWTAHVNLVSVYAAGGRTEMAERHRRAAAELQVMLSDPRVSLASLPPEVARRFRSG